MEGSNVLREYNITSGKIQTGVGWSVSGVERRGKREIADYVLVYKGIKLAVVEAKRDELEVGECEMQSKKYAEKLKLDTTYCKLPIFSTVQNYKIHSFFKASWPQWSVAERRPRSFAFSLLYMAGLKPPRASCGRSWL